MKILTTILAIVALGVASAGQPRFTQQGIDYQAHPAVPPAVVINGFHETFTKQCFNAIAKAFAKKPENLVWARWSYLNCMAAQYGKGRENEKQRVEGMAGA